MLNYPIRVSLKSCPTVSQLKILFDYKLICHCMTISLFVELFDFELAFVELSDFELQTFLNDGSSIQYYLNLIEYWRKVVIQSFQ